MGQIYIVVLVILWHVDMYIFISWMMLYGEVLQQQIIPPIEDYS
jgi:hypothetical protein